MKYSSMINVSKRIQEIAAAMEAFNKVIIQALDKISFDIEFKEREKERQKIN